MKHISRQADVDPSIVEKIAVEVIARSSAPLGFAKFRIQELAFLAAIRLPSERAGATA